VILISGFILWTFALLNFSLRDLNRSIAFTVAESGIEYYRWHLAHSPLDYKDGTGNPGPYIHNYYDKDGSILGQFILNITPPANGSTIVTIDSTGIPAADTSVQKIIRVKLGIPSFAKFAIVANDNLRFGTGTEVYGEVMSNKGIRFDALAHNVVKSALTTSTDPDPPNDLAFGVHTHINPVDPTPTATSSPPNRPDVFMSGRQISVPAVDFAALNQDLADLRNQASSSGVHFTSSTVFGYDLVFATSGKYSVYKVTSLVAPAQGCTSSSQAGWGTWSIKTESIFATGTNPASGLFFFEDNLWVRGQVSSTRATIGSGRFPDNAATRTNITVNSDLKYTYYDGKDVIALMAQNNINVGMVSSSTLRIDAAIMAQNGRAGRFYYSSACAPYDIRQTLTSYGMIGSSLRYGFAYTDGTGYKTRNLIYDGNLLYGPPPSFPLAGQAYNQILWEEVK